MYITPNALDASLNYIKNNVENLYICSSEPTTFLEASSTYRLGVKAAPTVTGPIAYTVDLETGRMITLAAITDGVIESAGTAAYLALTDDSNNELLYAKPLNVAEIIVAQLVFTMPSSNIKIKNPV